MVCNLKNLPESVPRIKKLNDRGPAAENALLILSASGPPDSLLDVDVLLPSIMTRQLNWDSGPLVFANFKDKLPGFGSNGAST
jgi:hypothetical protein